MNRNISTSTSTARTAISSQVYHLGDQITVGFTQPDPPSVSKLLATTLQILILGASGRTGQLTIASASKKGHTVTALVRNPSTFTNPDPSKVTVVKGTPISETDIDAAFVSCPNTINAVITTLAMPRTSEPPFGKPTAAPFFLRDVLKNTLAAMEKYGVKKIAIMSAFGAGNSWPPMSWLLKGMFSWTPMRYVVAEHDAVDGEVRKHEQLQWTEARATMLKDGDQKSARKLGETGTGVKIMDSVTRAGLAEYLVDSVEGEGQGAVVIAN
ncbi:hypothetical protein AC579_4872 [Pseudocercospora musae]|uniref:NAD(P)-binding domain-containing protein n=1 Tax=Pseudocercospora musae TaxID=113226 RepID=A0A139IJW5_9PEZI|nr:hypothetical protein AC579_4872 [Pseudocercospora musae]